jgi:hypothetical protein
MAERADRLDLVTVAEGPWLELEILRGALEEAGILSTIPDVAVKLWDPFITGANTLECRLQVPDLSREAAVELIAELEEHGEEALAAQPEFSEPTVAEPEPSEDDLRREALSAVGRRLCWSALFWVTSPIGVYLAYRYFTGVAGLERKPAGHAYAVAAAVLLAFNFAVLCLIIWLIPS